MSFGMEAVNGYEGVQLGQLGKLSLKSITKAVTKPISQVVRAASPVVKAFSPAASIIAPAILPSSLKPLATTIKSSAPSLLSTVGKIAAPTSFLKDLTKKYVPGFSNLTSLLMPTSAKDVRTGITTLQKNPELVAAGALTVATGGAGAAALAALKAAALNKAKTELTRVAQKKADKEQARQYAEELRAQQASADQIAAAEAEAARKQAEYEAAQRAQEVALAEVRQSAGLVAYTGAVAQSVVAENPIIVYGGAAVLTAAVLALALPKRRAA